MKCILHIGMEKTGTTSLQNFLYRNKENFYDMGFGVSTSMGIGNNKRLVSYAMRNNRFTDKFIFPDINNVNEKIAYDHETELLFQNEITNLGKCHTIIITSEHFHSRCIYKDEILKIKTLLSRFFDDIKIIIYLRPQIEVAISLYSTVLRAGNTLNFDDYLKENCINENYYYDYMKILDNWAGVFGEENIIVKLFDKENLINRNLIDNFLNYMGIKNIENFVSISMLNESLNPMGQELFRLSNIYKNESTQAFEQLLEKDFLGKGVMPSESKARKIQEQFSFINENVARKWFNRDKLFFINFSKFGDGICLDENQKNIFNFLFKSYKNEPMDINELLNILQVSKNFLDLNSKIDNQSIIIDLMRELSFVFEKSGDIQTAYKIIEKASLLRPSGVMIKEKLEEYRNILNER